METERRIEWKVQMGHWPGSFGACDEDYARRYDHATMLRLAGFLFSGAIRENAAYGRLDATDEEIAAVAKAVGLHAAVERQPLGYHTLVEERGGNLSVGERQLIGLARALLADPRILTLDEATSSVDTQTEEIVQRGLEVLMRGRTCFIIAHGSASQMRWSRSARGRWLR